MPHSNHKIRHLKPARLPIEIWLSMNEKHGADLAKKLLSVQGACVCQRRAHNVDSDGYRQSLGACDKSYFRPSS
jgi:hypothetical protein